MNMPGWATLLRVSFMGLFGSPMAHAAGGEVSSSGKQPAGLAGKLPDEWFAIQTNAK